MNSQEKALVLFSGGLDSRLAVKIMQEKGYEIIALRFKLPFSLFRQDNFLRDSKVKEKIIDCTKGKLLQEYLGVIRKPKFGRGAGLNPCVDCKIFMFRKAREYADRNKIKIIATGEVKGQRPMSQTSKALEKIDSNLGFKITRPLTELGIEGRKRKIQIELAKKFRIDFPQPSGGCLLCDKKFSERLKPILNNFQEIDIGLLRLGRHFESSEIVLGRNEKENLKLEEIYNKFKQGFLIIPSQPAPSALIKDRKHLEEGKNLIQKYSKKKINKFILKN